MSITQETSREAKASIENTLPFRRALIMQKLEGRELTVSELAQELYEEGYMPFYDRHYVSPRITELRQAGLVEPCGKRMGKMERMEAVWRIKEKENEQN